MFGKNEYTEINHLLNRRFEENKFLIAVHRGAWGGNIVENTIPAFRQALRMGGDLFECDVVASSDGELFAFHDGYEPRLLREEQNLQTMPSQKIDALELRNSLGELSGFHVERFRDVLAYFCHGELFNVDRSWRNLPAVLKEMRCHPHVLQQAVIKTHPNPKHLELLQACPEKYMYMPIVESMDELRTVLTYTGINTVGAEVLIRTPDSPFLLPENIQWIHEQGLFLWVNTLRLSRLDRHIMAGGMDDDLALQNPAAAWGKLMELGFDLFQTDWPYQLSEYRRTCH